ncbi:MAG: gltX, partial [Firmicutes bacterium]|nr:gltX [Bacillota bacterium]
MTNKVRTRFAPSPTGYMHVGNLRTALYAYLIAKHEGGDFILRIEDTDQERQVEGALEIIYNTLKATGLVHDEGPDIGGPVGPYIQSDRTHMYIEYAKQLIEKGEAYYCFCTKERLDLLRSNAEALKRPFRYDKHCMNLPKEEIESKLAAGIPYVIRQKNPVAGTTTFNDEIYGSITVENTELDDMILIKSDGFPTYNFANVVDDHLMGITHVVRGSEYLSSSPKYNRLYEAFGWDIPVYVHCPPIMKDATHKLSKRHGDASYEDLIAQGYLKDAVLNFIALLGWHPGTDCEIFSLQELIETFDYKHISKSPAIFDDVKLRWMNSEYIKRMSLDEFHALALPFYKQAITRDLDLKKVSELLHTRTEMLNEIP